MKDYKQLIKELPAKSVVFAFGRFNPPTIGHELLVKAVKKLAQQRNADHVIYASRSQDAKKNPLSVEKKVKYLKLMFKSTNFAAANDQERTFIEAAKALNKKYKNIIMIAGSDRIAEFKRLLNTYNGKDFNFDTIEVVSAGERDPDADDATGMSASKMRSLAVKGSYSEFKIGLPSSVRDIDGKRLMNDIRDGMGLEPIKEQIVLVKDKLREKFFRGEIFNEGDIVESAGERFTIVKRGSNHLLLKEASGNLVSKWIQDVQPTEEKEDMNEALTDKTLRPTDKIKVARIIATMLGVDNAETSSNPENLINQALRKVRTKALNPEALHILDKMLNLATEQGIQYDATLKPSKLKEGAMQIGGTDKIETPTDSVVVNKNSKYNIAKDILRFNDFKKLQKMNSVKKEHEETPGQPIQIGATLAKDSSDNLRRRKIKYHLGEQSKPPHVDMSAYEDESAHENTVDHIISSPEHTEKQKKLAKSFIDKLRSVTEQDDKAAKETAKANLMAKHAREKESLADKHTREKESLSELSTDLLTRYKKKAADQASAADKAGDYDKGNKRFSGIIKATKKQFDNDLKKEEVDLEEVQICETADAGLAAKAAKSGISIGTLRKVYRRGVAAWNSGHRPGTTPQQWGMARVNSYITKGKGTYHGADKDLREQEELEESVKIVDQDADLDQQHFKLHVNGKPEHFVHHNYENGHATDSKDDIHDQVKTQLKHLSPQHQKAVTNAVHASYRIKEEKLPAVPKDKESGLPKKYVAGLSASTAKARAAHFAKADKLYDSDPEAYKPAPGDATAKTKPSKHTLKYRAMFGEDMDEELYEACWDTHKQIGMKKKGNRMVPDCVPKNEEAEVCTVCGKSPCECEKPSAGPVATDKPFDPFFKEDEDEFDFQEPSDDEIESMADELSDDDYLDTYEDDELGIIDDETGEELPEDEEEEKKLKESALMEVLSRIERMKARTRIRRTAAKRERATKIALKRYSNTATINKRARRLAIKLMKKRLLRGRDPSKVSVGEKERIERTLEKRKAVIGRIATRLAPRVRKVEKARLSHTKYTQGSQPSVF